VNAPRTLIPPLVRVRLPSTLATRAGVERLNEIRATTVEAALESLAARHPQLRPTLWSGPRSLNPNVMIFHNETLVRDELLDTVLGERDMIDVVPAVESG
jgi:molybdopterin converting factor small subunit